MAKVKDNYVVKGLSGKIGKHLILKTNKWGLTYTCLPPDRTNVISTKGQQKLRNNFAKAVAYAKSVLQDPVKAEHHQKEKNKSLYIRALKDYLNQRTAVLKKGSPIIISNDFILKHHLNIRQVKALQFIHKRGRISNSNYQRLNQISKPTATRDLQDLVKKAVLTPSGTRGAGAFYELMGSDS
jgi:predicted HTH transcriptional regulator